MNPNLPELAYPAPSPPPAPPRQPFWDYQDLAVFAGLAFPSLIFALLAVKGFSRFVHIGKPAEVLLAQLLWYALVFGALYLLLRMRYGQPFWRSLGWAHPWRGANLAFFAGPFLAIGIGLLGYFIRTPQIEMPFKQMFEDRLTIFLFALFAVVLGPVCEELAFRGFLMPLLARSLGAAASIVVTALLFGSLHAPEYQWSWRHVLLITFAGSVFGWVRYKTGSTAASTFMHSSYNLTQLAAFLAQSRVS
jgi:membrane protease YdiL (CAAX protease family)